jgi:dihydrofolate reductase
VFLHSPISREEEVEVGKLSVFNFVTINGLFKGPNNDISWAHEAQEHGYAADMLQSRGTLLFGRVTYELMSQYWPTPQAFKDVPAVANGMNDAEKIVFSKTLKKADWKNTTIVRDHIEDEVKKMKAAGKNMTLLGSGSIVTLFANHGLIDEYQLMVHPVALGDGTPFLKGLERRLDLKLASTRDFKSGTHLLVYQARQAATAARDESRREEPVLQSR